MQKVAPAEKLSAKEIIEMDKQYVIHGWGYNPYVIVEAHGATFTDINGKQYIDCMSMSNVAAIGHTHPRYVKAVKEQLDLISHTTTSFINAPRAMMGKKMSEIAPGRMKNNSMSYFSDGGSEANETAIKFALATTKKKQIISTYLSYLGGTVALAGLSDPFTTGGHEWLRETVNRFPGSSLIPAPYCYRCPFGLTPDTCDVQCAKFLELEVKHSTGKDVAAFVTEPIKGVGGNVVPMHKDYWPIIQETCSKYSMLLIIDEVITGMGRTGKVWACDYYNIEPDIMTAAKALGGGIPISATVIRNDLIPSGLSTEAWHHFTTGGGPLLAAGGIATIDVMLDEKLPEKAARQGERMTKRLKEMELRHRLIGEVRGPGLIIGVELVKDRKTKEPAPDELKKIWTKCMENGVYLGSTKLHGTVLHIKPPLSISDEDADKVLNTLDKALSEVEAGK